MTHIRMRAAAVVLAASMALTFAVGNATAQDSDRVNRLEAQLRALTGQVEELHFQLRALQDQLKRSQEDNEFRFRDLEGSGGGAGGGSANAPTPGPRTEAVPGVPPDAIGALAANPDGQSSGGESGMGATGPGTPPSQLGTLSMDAPLGPDFGPIDLTQGSGPDVAMIAPSGDARTDYNSAYNLILSGDYDQAETAFRQFLDMYPEDALAPDAQYWLGESFFVRAQFREAADEFLVGYRTYQSSGKAPDSLLKLGMSLAGLGEPKAACSTYAAVLTQFPDISTSLRQRVKTEQASAKC